MAYTWVLVALLAYAKHGSCNRPMLPGLASPEAYDLILTKAQKCDDVGNGKFDYSTDLKRLGNGTYLYSSVIKLEVPIDDKFSATVIIEKKKSNGDYEKLMEKSLKSCEEYWEFAGPTMQDAFRTSGQQVEGCPISEGEYKIDNWKVELKIPIPMIPYGMYRATVTFYYDGEIISCLIIHAESVPKGQRPKETSD